jgi:hypothetical protein
MTPMLEAGLRAAAALSRYEAAPQAQVVRQGGWVASSPAARYACQGQSGGRGGEAVCSQDPRVHP